MAEPQYIQTPPKEELQYIETLLAAGLPLTREQQDIWDKNQNALFQPVTTNPFGIPTTFEPPYKSKEEYDNYLQRMEMARLDLDKMNAGLNPTVTDPTKTPTDPLVLTTNEELLKQKDKEPPTMGGFPFVSPTGQDLKTDLYSLGRSIGAPAGTPGKALGIIGNAGSALFEIARGVTSGIGYEKRQDYINQWYLDKQQDNTYKSAPQYGNENGTGGDPKKKYGGLFENGGVSGTDPIAPAQQAMAPQQTQRTTQMQQLVAMMLQDGDEPQIIVEELVSRGVPQGQAVQVVQQVVETMSQAPAQPQMPAPQGPMSQPSMEFGGVHGRKE